MSDRLDMDLDLDLPEVGPDAPVGEWDDDLMDDFPDDDPANLSATTAAAGAAAAPGRSTDTANAPVTPNAMVPPEGRRSRDPNGDRMLGVSHGLLMALAALTLGAGALTAAGGAPESLFDFSGFRDPLTIGDFRLHPVNAFWFSTLVALIAAVLAGVGIRRYVSRLRAEIAAQDELLDAVCALDPDEPASWRREVILADADLAATTGNLLGHYHLQQAKLTRYVGLEGELHRLEKAMAEDSSTDLQGDWENPVAGSLADQAMRLLGARDAAVEASSQQQQAHAEQGPDLVAGLRDAHHWQAGAVEQVQHLGAALERLSRQLGKLSATVPGDQDHGRRFERLVQALTAVRDGLQSLPISGSGPLEGVRAATEGLVERASRLAFQIAMEVARLGTKGERLLPLAQDLEELITELRTAFDKDKAAAEVDDPRERILATIRGRLGELEPQVLERMAVPELPQMLAEMAPLAGDSAATLKKLLKNCGGQSARLRDLGQLAALLTGLPIDLSDATGEVGTGMLVERFDPFAGGQPEGGLVADPFASSGTSIFDSPAGGGDGFARAILPGQEDGLFATPASRAAPFELDLAEALPSPTEKVYDLEEFDAQLLPAEPTAAAPSETVHELSEFDAVRIG